MSRTDQTEMPHADEAERAVLGALLKNGEAFDEVYVVLAESTGFYAPRHRLIYEAMTALNQEGKSLDVTTVSHELHSKQGLEKVGGRTYLVELIEAVASTRNVREYAVAVRDCFLYRQIINACMEISHSCYVQELSARQLIESLHQTAMDIGRGIFRGGFEALSRDNTAFLQRVHDYETGVAQKERILTGFAGLDRVMGGLEKGTTTIIAGKTSQGKTQVALQIAEHVAVSQRLPVAFLSLEMSARSLNDRLHYSLSHLDSQRLKQGQLTAEEHDRLAHAVARTTGAPFYVDDSGLVSPAELLSSARRAQAQYGIQLLIVDYLQLMDHAGGETREREVADISRRLKAIAKILNIPLIAISQLRRTDKDSNKVPVLSDLRESGALEQDADNVIFVHHRAGRNSQIHSEFVLAKHRSGPIHPGIAMSFVAGRWQEITRKEEV